MLNQYFQSKILVLLMNVSKETVWPKASVMIAIAILDTVVLNVNVSYDFLIFLFYDFVPVNVRKITLINYRQVNELFNSMDRPTKLLHVCR